MGGRSRICDESNDVGTSDRAAKPGGRFDGRVAVAANEDESPPSNSLKEEARVGDDIIIIIPSAAVAAGPRGEVSGDSGAVVVKLVTGLGS